MRRDVQEAVTKLRHDWCDALTVEELPGGALMAVTPFLFPDGDSFPILLERTRAGWRISDGGVAVSHLQFAELDLTEGRRRLLERFAAAQGGSVIGDVLSLAFDEFPRVDDIAYFVQLISQIAGMPLHDSTERDPEQFRTRAIRTIEEWLSDPSLAERNWHADEDKRQLFPADLRLETGQIPVVAFFAGSAQKAERSMSYVGQYSKWGLHVKPILAYAGTMQSDTKFRAQEVLGDDAAVVQVDEALTTTAYQGLSRVLASNGVPIKRP